MAENKEKISLDIIMDKPLLPLRDVVVYPHMVIPLFVGREKSKLALEEAMSEDKKILLSSQKRSDIDDPSIKDIKKVSKEIAITVAKKSFSEGLTNMAIPQNIETSRDRIIYNPVYPDYI